ncbi:hypothetical protein [Bifidobacterium simiarum]|uniref:hypothetical protein n=1 Tax=Bifidobacterium simiarum TaxID=2045441 RepID=UPI001BDCAA83|nr:hypothetical protein [Bifidobacterium simiarum]MBT1167249.1 hypothetical protein [Bifidobacterium simiarum]
MSDTKGTSMTTSAGNENATKEEGTMSEHRLFGVCVDDKSPGQTEIDKALVTSYFPQPDENGDMRVGNLIRLWDTAEARRIAHLLKHIVDDSGIDLNEGEPYFPAMARWAWLRPLGERDLPDLDPEVCVAVLDIEAWNYFLAKSATESETLRGVMIAADFLAGVLEHNYGVEPCRSLRVRRPGGQGTKEEKGHE